MLIESMLRENQLYLVTVNKKGDTFQAWVRKNTFFTDKPKDYEQIGSDFPSLEKAWKYITKYDCGYV